MAINNKNKIIAKNTMVMYLRMLILLVLSLFTARIVFNALGEVNYGIYNVVGGIIVFFSFLNSGLSAATRKYITSEIGSGTDESRRKVFNTCVMSHIAISGVVLFLAETVGLWFVNHGLNIPEERYFAANVVYQFSVLTAILGIMQTPFQAVIIAYEKLSVYAYFTIFDVVFKIVIILFMQYCDFDKLIMYSILMFLTGGITMMAYRVYCYRKFALCKWMLIKDKAVFKDIFAFTGWSLFGQAAVVATNQGVSVVVNIYASVVANAAMGVSNTIVNVVNGFVTNFQTAFNPQITKSYVAKDFDYVKSLIFRTSKISSCLLLVMAIPILFECENLLTVWLGNYPLYAPEFCCLALGYIYLEGISAPLWMLIYSDSHIKRYQIVLSSAYFLNIILSWAFLAMGCVPYVVMAVRVSVNVLLVIIRLYYARLFLPGLRVDLWLREIMGRALAAALLAFLLTYMFKGCLHVSPLCEIFAVGSFSVVVCCFLAYLICLNRGERKLVAGVITKILFRK